ncbi:7672_t:CDS:2 [Rhizophagus irregularis]|nr:7672_t:CDS:2 [Rhizophagus irregularis]
MYTDLLKLFSKQKHIQITYNFKLFYNKNIIILRELCKLIYNKINVINELDFHIGINFSEEGLKLQLAVEELVKLQDHFRGLKVLTYSGDNEVLCFLVKHCKRIESLKLYQVSYGKNVLNNDDLSIQLISSQKNLRNLEIHDWKISPSSNITSITSPPSITNITTLLQSIQSQANSLRSIKLINCNFNKCKPLWALSNCLNLEEIIIRENHNFNEKLLIPLTKDEFIDLNEIFSRIIFNSKDSLRIISINGFKTLQSLRNTLNSIVECKNLIKLDIMLEKSENTLPLLLSIIKHNQSLEKLYIVSDTRNLANQGNNNNLFIDVNQFLHLFVNLLPQNFKLLKMYTPDWCFTTDTLNQFLEKTKFRIKSMCWVNYECDLDCGEVLRKYAKLNGYKLLFGEDCRFINNSIIKMNVFFEKFITS